MRRRVLTALSAAVAILVLAALASAPASVEHIAAVPNLDEPLDAWLAARETAANRRSPLIAGTEKRIRWYADRVDSRAPLAVVYLHGFSATRQEIAPVGELIADGLGANLFEPRLRGDAGHRVVDVAVTREALTIGAAIGEEIVLVGTSTGATLALAMAGHPAFDAVCCVVLLSPNFAPLDGSAEILTWPGGPQLAALMVGETRSWTAHNARQEQYWSTTYPMDAVVEMMRLVKLARRKLPLGLEQSVLTLYSPDDQVIDVERIRAALGQIDSPRMETVEIRQSGDPSNHVLAGDILAPANNRLVADHVVHFVTGL